jgi:hypothetical protein
MSDLQKYIAKRKLTDQEFSENHELGYRKFKAGVMREISCEKSGVNAIAIGRGAKKTVICP